MATQPGKARPPQPGILLGPWHRLSPPCRLIPYFDLKHQCSHQDGLGRAEGDSVYYQELCFRIVLSLMPSMCVLGCAIDLCSNCESANKTE